MIAFGCAITDPALYERCARPGIERAREADSEVIALGTAGSIFRNYNLIIERALEFDELEALVIVHQDAELVDDETCAKLRAALADPDTGLVGCAGAVGVRSLAWWEGSVTWAAFTHRYAELGGGEVPSLTWLDAKRPSYAGLGEVDCVDGFVLGFAPRALAEVRFDESLGRFHGYDYDICMQVRDRGMKVVTADIRTIHHHSLELITDPEVWINAHVRLAEKWHGRFPDDGGGSEDWRERARASEAQAAAARLLGGRELLVREATERRDRRLLEQAWTELAEIHGSLSWRLTAPLRRLSQALRRAFSRRSRA